MMKNKLRENTCQKKKFKIEKIVYNIKNEKPFFQRLKKGMVFLSNRKMFF
jgi:hypothetical protein